MNDADESSPVEQRQALLRQMQVQRKVVAQQLAPVAAAPGRYPRSVIMRLLIRRSALLGKLAALALGARLAGSLPRLLGLLHLLRAVAGARTPPA